MLLAAFYLAELLYAPAAIESVPVVIEPQTQSSEPVVEVAEPVVLVRKPMIPEAALERQPVQSNLEAPLDQRAYEEMIKTIPSFVQPEPVASLAETFMFDILHRSNVQRMSITQYNAVELNPGDVVAYIWMSNTDPVRILQYATICTAYGNIYVTCELNDEGCIANPTAAPEIYYDNVALSNFVNVVAADMPTRFEPGYRFDPNKLQSMDDLKFLFGDTSSQENSFNVGFFLQ